MTALHSDPLYQRNARIIRSQVRAAHKREEPVPCVGCGRPIYPGMTYDVGHRIDASRGGSHALSNLGPQHRSENRRAGGRLGAQKTNDRLGRTIRRARGLPNAW